MATEFPGARRGRAPRCAGETAVAAPAPPCRVARFAAAGSAREVLAALRRSGRALLAAPPGLLRREVLRLAACDAARPVLAVSGVVARLRDDARVLTASGVRAQLVPTRGAAAALDRLAAAPDTAPAALLLTPAAARRAALRARLCALRPALVVIDDAHAASANAHVFDAAYRALPALLAALPEAAVLAVTGAARPAVCTDLLARLGLGPEAPRYVAGFARPALALRVAEPADRRARDRLVAGVLAAWLGTPEAARGGAVVVAVSRRDAERESVRLAARGWRALAYHTGLPAARRDRLRRGFGAGRFDVVVAAAAEAAELCRADVRAVVHLTPPDSIERYCEAAWLAGADGAPAEALLCVAPGDPARCRRRLEREAHGLARAGLAARWRGFLELLRYAYSRTPRHAWLAHRCGWPCGTAR